MGKFEMRKELACRWRVGGYLPLRLVVDQFILLCAPKIPDLVKLLSQNRHFIQTGFSRSRIVRIHRQPPHTYNHLLPLFAGLEFFSFFLSFFPLSFRISSALLTSIFPFPLLNLPTLFSFANSTNFFFLW